jgi:hypothetical protein
LCKSQTIQLPLDHSAIANILHPTIKVKVILMLFIKFCFLLYCYFLILFA